MFISESRMQLSKNVNNDVSMNPFIAADAKRLRKCLNNAEKTHFSPFCFINYEDVNSDNY